MTDTDIIDNNTELNKKLTNEDTLLLNYTNKLQSPTKSDLSDFIVNHSINIKELRDRCKDFSDKCKDLCKDLNTNIKMESERMANNTYSKKEIDDKFSKLEAKLENLYTKNEIDLKFENLEQKISSGFENMTLRMEKLLLEFKADTKKEQESNKKWLIGIGISIIGLLITAIVKFL